MEFHIENTEVYELNKSIVASGNAMRTKMANNTEDFTEKDLKRAKALGAAQCGQGHDNFLNGIVVQFDLFAPLYMWKQIQRYHFLDFVSSQSTMHKLSNFDIASQCTEDVDPVILNRYEEMLKLYHEFGNDNPLLWRRLVASLPCGFVLGATMTTNYRQLKTIYLQRKNHRLKEWHEFCAWCESLPHFMELIGLENINSNTSETAE